jgi:hypothetical protein
MAVSSILLPSRSRAISGRLHVTAIPETSVRHVHIEVTGLDSCGADQNSNKSKHVPSDRQLQVQPPGTGFGLAEGPRQPGFLRCAHGEQQYAGTELLTNQLTAVSHSSRTVYAHKTDIDAAQQ